MTADHAQAIADAARAFVRAQADSIKASEARAAMPIGSSRARVTSANARWASCAEDRDRKAAALRAAIVAAGFAPVTP